MSDTNRGKYQEKIIYVLKYSDKYNEVRDLIVINGQPFYQSTGGSSSAEKKGTWQPFLFTITESMLMENTEQKIIGCNASYNQNPPPLGYIVKTPGTNPYTNVEIDTYFSLKTQADFDKLGILPKSFQTFGNIQAMCISMLLGSPFWEGEKGLKLKSYLETNYGDLIKKQQEYLQVKFVPSTETDNPIVVNEWLLAQGSHYSNDSFLGFPTDNDISAKKELLAMREQIRIVAYSYKSQGLFAKSGFDDRRDILIMFNLYLQKMFDSATEKKNDYVKQIDSQVIKILTDAKEKNIWTTHLEKDLRQMRDRAVDYILKVTPAQTHRF